MIKFYFNLSPNPMKVALLLEELALPYEPIPVDTRKGEQFSSDYLALNPNAKVKENYHTTVVATVDGENRNIKIFIERLDKPMDHNACLYHRGVGVI